MPAAFLSRALLCLRLCVDYKRVSRTPISQPERCGAPIQFLSLFRRAEPLGNQFRAAPYPPPAERNHAREAGRQ